MALWEDYFIYAAALGVTETVEKAYKEALSRGILKWQYFQIWMLCQCIISQIEIYLIVLERNLTKGISNSTRRKLISSSRSDSSGFGSGGFSGGSSFGGGGRSGGGAF